MDRAQLHALVLACLLIGTGLLLIALVLTGCAETPAGSYLVKVDPSFTPTEQAAVFESVDQWRSATPALSIAAELSTCDGAPDGRICVRPDHDAGPGLLGVTTREYWTTPSGGEKADTALYVERIARHPGMFVAAAAHELGHAMGLVHTGPGTVMCHDVGEMAMGVTDADAEQWKAVRGL